MSSLQLTAALGSFIDELKESVSMLASKLSQNIQELPLLQLLLLPCTGLVHRTCFCMGIFEREELCYRNSPGVFVC